MNYKLNHAILAMGILSLITSGCSGFKGKVTTQEVEKTQLSDRAVEMPVIDAEVYTAVDVAPVEPVKAAPVKAELEPMVPTLELAPSRAEVVEAAAVPIRKDLVEQPAVISQVEVAQPLAVESEVLAQRRMALVSADVALVPEKKQAVIAEAMPIDPKAELVAQADLVKPLVTSYHVVVNQKILNAWRAQMGTSFYTVEKLYKDALASGSDMTKIAQLWVPYKFKVSAAKGSYISDYVTFTPKDLFDGFGVFGYLTNGKFSAYGGVGRGYTDRLQKNLAIDFFQSSAAAKVFPVGNANLYGFQQQVGSKIFALKLDGSNLKLDTLVATLPLKTGVNKVYSQRVGQAIVNKLGTLVQLNGALVIYTDANKNVLSLYSLNPVTYVSKDIYSQCQSLLEAGLFDSSFGINCGRVSPTLGVGTATMVPTLNSTN